MEAVRDLPKACLVQNSSCFSKDSMEKLKQIMYDHTFPDGANIFCEGDAANRLYFVRTGKVKLTKLSVEGKEYIMSIFHTGDFFGQFDPFRDSVHAFTAHAVGRCEIGIVQKCDLEVLLWQHGDLAIEFMNWMGYMHRLTQTKYRDLMMYGKPGALCSTLIRLSNCYGSASEDGIRIDLKLTNAELADHVGCTRESVNRMLSDLKKSGAVAIQDGIITIRNIDYLRQVCNCESCPKELCRI
ncbi:Crp/Fnr family transcriptional regulator [Paenibacillus cisolokensis]|jgi:cAMP-binding proteins - catabolite gene activator and regulatory subunit of cAMP-dependent protein kinases|uniref:Crp/Fnr family transcriptional regulator n=1 Tax=Paenibacillus cisolokensis TaxID=1658519 RepID=A0ABQ4N2Z9_9BACL|nr:Crp/Fnr family transcriptional regulator [Paenibacillus cisolokensis]GIQ62578.1 Crp/Fnr family transcriptional regulator [Paenibacillus cisolokensis]